MNLKYLPIWVDCASQVVRLPFIQTGASLWKYLSRFAVLCQFWCGSAGRHYPFSLANDNAVSVNLSWNCMWGPGNEHGLYLPSCVTRFPDENFLNIAILVRCTDDFWSVCSWEINIWRERCVALVIHCVLVCWCQWENNESLSTSQPCQWQLNRSCAIEPVLPSPRNLRDVVRLCGVIRHLCLMVTGEWRRTLSRRDYDARSAPTGCRNWKGGRQCVNVRRPTDRKCVCWGLVERCCP